MVRGRKYILGSGGEDRLKSLPFSVEPLIKRAPSPIARPLHDQQELHKLGNAFQLTAAARAQKYSMPFYHGLSSFKSERAPPAPYFSI